MPGHQHPTRLTKPRKLQSFRVDRDRKTVKFPTFERPGRVLKSGCGASAEMPHLAHARARSMSPVGRVFIGSFAATDSGLSFLHR